MITQTPPLVPVTLLTGFLGAGKTTLINSLLAENKKEKILIIENEFGPVNIDSQLLSNQTNIDVIQMTNGCICCSVQGEWREALHTLNRQRQEGTLLFDRLIIEATGLADPAPLLQIFFIDDQLRITFQLDGVVTLVDGVHILQQLENHAVARSQIGFADRLMITKCDLISKETQDQIIKVLTAINPKAPIRINVTSPFTKADWLDIRAFDLTDELLINTAFVIQKPQHPSVLLSPKYKPAKNQLADNNIGSYLFEGTRLDLKKIGEFVEQLIAKYGNDMLRYKGVLAIEGNAKRLIVQGVHKIVGFDYGSPWRDDEPQKSQLIIISRPLPFDLLYDDFLKTQVA